MPDIQAMTNCFLVLRHMASNAGIRISSDWVDRPKWFFRIIQTLYKTILLSSNRRGATGCLYCCCMGYKSWFLEDSKYHDHLAECNTKLSVGDVPEVHLCNVFLMSAIINYVSKSNTFILWHNYSQTKFHDFLYFHGQDQIGCRWFIFKCVFAPIDDCKSLLTASISVYVQYLALNPGLSYRPSPASLISPPAMLRWQIIAMSI